MERKNMDKKSKKRIIIVISTIITVVIILMLMLFFFCRKFTVSFDSVGGSNVSSLKVSRYEFIKEPEDPTKDGYVFAGWYLNGKLFDFNTKVKGDIELEAKWVRPQEGIGFKDSQVSLFVEESKDLNIILLDGIEKEDLIWTSSDEKIIKVDQNGKVTAISLGTAKITVKTKDGKYSTTITVSVVEETIPVTDVTITGSSSVTVGSSIKLTVKFTPDNATNKKITWKSSNNGIATVDQDGVVKGVKSGTVTITVTTEDGNKTATKTITVTNKSSNPSQNPNPEPSKPEQSNVPVTDVSISGETVVVEGSSITLTAIVNPENATNKEVTWQSSNNGIATVSPSGVVTGISAGTTTITATTKDGNKVATHDITVKEKPGSYSITLTAISTTIGEKQYSLSVTRNGEAFTDYNWIQFGDYGAPFPVGQYVSAGIVEKNIRGILSATITITNPKYVDIDGENISATVNIN